MQAVPGLKHVSTASKSQLAFSISLQRLCAICARPRLYRASERGRRKADNRIKVNIVTACCKPLLLHWQRCESPFFRHSSCNCSRSMSSTCERLSRDHQCALQCGPLVTCPCFSCRSRSRCSRFLPSSARSPRRGRPKGMLKRSSFSSFLWCLGQTTRLGAPRSAWLCNCTLGWYSALPPVLVGPYERFHPQHPPQNPPRSAPTQSATVNLSLSLHLSSFSIPLPPPELLGSHAARFRSPSARCAARSTGSCRKLPSRDRSSRPLAPQMCLHLHTSEVTPLNLVESHAAQGGRQLLLTCLFLKGFRSFPSLYCQSLHCH